MVETDSRKRLPPYVSYRTFRNFIDGMKRGIPGRIDRSYWGELFSGSNGTQAVSALRFFGLIDANHTPTSQLKQMVEADSVQRTGIIQKLTYENYPFILKSNSIDPKTATFAQLEESFKSNFQLTPDVLRKCTKFFVEMAIEGGISLSLHIVKKSGIARTSTGTKKTFKKIHGRTNQNLQIPQSTEEIPENLSWDKMLLAKFPPFDPAWNDNVKLKWFEAFDELLKRRVVRTA